MQDYKQHIILRILSVMLITALILPTIVKFTHIYESHNHEVCTNKTKAHIHESDFDCAAYKFKIIPVFSFTFKYADIVIPVYNYSITKSEYHFISSYKSIGISLRGPPYFAS